MPLGLLEQPPYVAQAAKVGPDRPGRAAARPDRLDHLAGGRPMVDEAEHHRRAVTGQALHDRPADAPRATRDQRLLPGEHTHAVSSATAVRPPCPALPARRRRIIVNDAILPGHLDLWEDA